MSKKNIHTICSLAAIFSLAAIGLAGCQYSQLPDYSTRKPTIKDLTGTWEPTQETITDIKTRGGYPTTSSRLILRANGTFSMLNMPDCVILDRSTGWESSHKKLKSAKGKWHIESFQHEGSTVWDVGFAFDKEALGALPSGPGPALITWNDFFRFHFSFGDADIGHAVEFQKEAA